MIFKLVVVTADPCTSQLVIEATGEPLPDRAALVMEGFKELTWPMQRVFNLGRNRIQGVPREFECPEPAELFSCGGVALNRAISVTFRWFQATLQQTHQKQLEHSQTTIRQDLPAGVDWSHAMLDSLRDVVMKAAECNLFCPDPLVSWETVPCKADCHKLLDLWIKKR